MLAAALFAFSGARPARGDLPVAEPAAQPAGKVREATADEYRQHLAGLKSVVEACAQARDRKNCDPALVGPDDRVPLGNAERRLARYDWLRALLAKAQIKDAPPEKPVANTGEAARPPQLVTSQLLQQAEARLDEDLAQANLAAAVQPSAHASERETMKQVLAGRDFRSLEAPTARDAALEKLSGWLNQLFRSAARLRATASWVGRALVYGFVLVVCVGLALGLLQLERRWRIRLTPENTGPNAAAASVRDWQLWLQDARRLAAAAEWREAIHGVYWAAISRLESRRLWSADRARTPREYLALVAAGDSRQPQLAALTRCFERVWYGGRAAGESDYLQAATLANALIDGVSAANEGGAR